MPLAGNVRLGELFGRLEQRVDRDHVIARAVEQQDRRRLATIVAGGRFRLEMFRADQDARKAKNRGRRVLAAQSDMQRHHGSLTETHDRKFRIIQSRRCEFCVQKSVDRRPRRGRAAPALVRVAHRQREPLTTGWRHGAAVRRMRADEQRVRQPALPLLADLDQVVAVGAIAVQEDHKLFGGPGFRGDARAGERIGHGAFCVLTGLAVLRAGAGVVKSFERAFEPA